MFGLVAAATRAAGATGLQCVVGGQQQGKVLVLTVCGGLVSLLCWDAFGSVHMTKGITITLNNMHAPILAFLRL
jgi:hypothetical protein